MNNAIRETMIWDTPWIEQDNFTGINSVTFPLYDNIIFSSNNSLINYYNEGGGIAGKTTGYASTNYKDLQYEETFPDPLPRSNLSEPVENFLETSSNAQMQLTVPLKPIIPLAPLPSLSSLSKRGASTEKPGKIDKTAIKRERNRLAAERCRQRKNRLLDELQNECNQLRVEKAELERRNQELITIVKALTTK